MSEHKTELSKRCGFVAVIGMPNAGKSTLINALVGQKVSIVSKRVQTTRCRVLGITIHDNRDQVIFIDTPGVFKAQKNMEHAMVNAAFDSVDDADSVLHLVSADDKRALENAKLIIKKLPKNKPVLLALNKIDAVKKEVLLHLAQALNEAFDYHSTFMISALKEQGLPRMLDIISETLPAGEWHYDEDEITTMPMRLMAAEITREQIFQQLYNELPHSTLVETEVWEDFDNGSLKITQAIFVQRDTQKAIVLGKGGTRIKQIGKCARGELEELTGRVVHLKLFVKVKENWPDNPENYALMGL